VLLARFVMQWQRISFRNPIGQFVVATTDWLVLPLRRFIPGLGAGSGQPAAGVGGAGAGGVLALAARRHRWAPIPFSLLVVMWGVGLLETVKVALYLLMGVVLMSAILSWVNPHAPMAGIINAMAEPFLRPFRRIIPLIGGVDLSPIALLLVLQVAQRAGDGQVHAARAGLRHDWLNQAADGSLMLSLHIQPGAKKTEIAGLHGEALKIRLAAPPVDGKANAALIAFLAKTCGVPKSAVELVSGDTSRTKRVRSPASMWPPWRRWRAVDGGGRRCDYSCENEDGTLAGAVFYCARPGIPGSAMLSAACA
jgi:YggT family protein